MLTVPMFARYMTEVTAGQPLRDVPWERPAGVKADDTGGKLRTTMEEVLADGQTDAATAAHKPHRRPPRPIRPRTEPARRGVRPARQRASPANCDASISSRSTSSSVALTCRRTVFASRTSEVRLASAEKPISVAQGFESSFACTAGHCASQRRAEDSSLNVRR